MKRMVSMKRVLTYRRRWIYWLSGCGYAGGSFLRQQYRIVACDQFGSGDKWRNLSRHRIFEIISPTELMPWLAEHTSEISAILHFGASSSTTETNVDSILQHNFTLSRQLWLWATAQKVPVHLCLLRCDLTAMAANGFTDDIAKRRFKRTPPT